MTKNASEGTVPRGAELSSAQFLPFQWPHWAQRETPEHPGGGGGCRLPSLFSGRPVVQLEQQVVWAHLFRLRAGLGGPQAAAPRGTQMTHQPGEWAYGCHLWWRPRRSCRPLTRWRAWTTTWSPYSPWKGLSPEIHSVKILFNFFTFSMLKM